MPVGMGIGFSGVRFSIVALLQIAAIKKKLVIEMAKVVRKKKAPSLPLDVPVNVKVKGESAMRKNVRLVASTDGSMVNVMTGRRGRPARLVLSDIERVRVL